ncbi:ABC transporter substrate-binding protein [Streptomyces exfoliatus]|uniref:ABC transporter substrate-binding protein n=1 Tax=Streptomyces exfoliatus TaxID=1905 RepID=UPI003C2AE88C
MNNAKIGTAILGGYMLGRTKKGKLAMGLAMAFAGSRIKPGQLGKSLAQSPLLSNVNQQVRGELTSAGKAAATTVLNAKAEHLADALHQRTASLRESGPKDEPEHEQEPEEQEQDEQDEQEQDAQEPEHEDEHEEQHEEEREDAGKGAGAKAAAKKSGTTKQTASRTSAPARSKSAQSKPSRTKSSRRPDDG